MEQIASYTGRSLATFKRDLKNEQSESTKMVGKVLAISCLRLIKIGAEGARRLPCCWFQKTNLLFYSI